jgi:hypothetical protein
MAARHLKSLKKVLKEANYHFNYNPVLLVHSYPNPPVPSTVIIRKEPCTILLSS